MGGAVPKARERSRRRQDAARFASEEAAAAIREQGVARARDTRRAGGRKRWCEIGGVSLVFLLAFRPEVVER